MVFGNEVKKIQAAAYNGAHTVVEFCTNGIHVKRGLAVLMLIPTWAITTVTKGVLDRLIKGHCI